MSRKNKSQQMIRLDRLQELCKDFDHGKKGYGYAYFREFVAIPHSALSRVLYNNADFSLETMVKISNATGVSIDWLLGLSDIKYLDKNDNKPCEINHKNIKKLPA